MTGVKSFLIRIHFVWAVISGHSSAGSKAPSFQNGRAHQIGLLAEKTQMSSPNHARSNFSDRTGTSSSLPPAMASRQRLSASPPKDILRRGCSSSLSLPCPQVPPAGAADFARANLGLGGRVSPRSGLPSRSLFRQTLLSFSPRPL